MEAGDVVAIMGYNKLNTLILAEQVETWYLPIVFYLIFTTWKSKYIKLEGDYFYDR